MIIYMVIQYRENKREKELQEEAPHLNIVYLDDNNNNEDNDSDDDDLDDDDLDGFDKEKYKSKSWNQESNQYLHNYMFI